MSTWCSGELIIFSSSSNLSILGEALSTGLQVVSQLCPQVPENLIHRLYVSLPAEAVVGAAAGAAVVVIKLLSQHHAAGQHPQLQVSNFQPGYLKEGEGNTLTVFQTLQCPIKKTLLFCYFDFKNQSGKLLLKILH